MPLHACRNCRHYVSRGSLRCLVPEAAKVLDPKAANRCSFFEFVDRSLAESEGASAHFDSGQVNGTPGGGPASPRDRWEKLFEEDG